jgi:O-antigen/teichoic acid export membrane protein
MGFNLQRFLKHSMVYTIGNVLYRGASFLLVPLYARYLHADQYGTLEMLYTTAGVFQTLFSSGVAHAALRFYFEYDNERDKNSVISSAIIGSGVVSLIGVGILLSFAPMFSQLLFSSATNSLAFRIVFASLVIEISREINLAVVRAKEKSTLFVSMALVQLLVQVAANVYLVVYLQKGVVGILLGNFVSTLAVWTILMASTIRSCGFRFELSKLLAVWKYGYPLMLSGLSFSLLGSSDRYMLNIYSTLGAIGVYALGLRIAKIVPVLIVDPFTKSYGPYRFAIMERPRAEVVYSQVLTYFFLLAAVALLAITAFGREIVRVASSEEYWGASAVLGPLLVVGVMDGVTYCFQTAIYVKKKTKYIFYISLLSGVVNFLLNAALIPHFGIHGAAAAAALTGVGTAVITLRVAQRLLPVPYEFGRLLKIAAVTVVLALPGMLIHPHSLFVAIPFKLSLVAAFPVALTLLRLWTAEELDRFQQARLWLRGKLAPHAAQP